MMPFPCVAEYPAQAWSWLLGIVMTGHLGRSEDLAAPSGGEGRLGERVKRLGRRRMKPEICESRIQLQTLS